MAEIERSLVFLNMFLLTTFSSSILHFLPNEYENLLQGQVTWLLVSFSLQQVCANGAACHTLLLSQKREHFFEALTSSTKRAITTIAFVRAKTVSSTVPDDRFWIKAFISSCSYSDIKKFLGCSNCNRKTETERNEVFHCSWCHKKDSTSIPRLALTFDAKDDTGSITLTAFTDIVTQLFGKTIEELYKPDSPEILESYQQIAESLCSKPVYIELGPTSALSRNGVLKWVLKSASLEPNEPTTYLSHTTPNMATSKVLPTHPSSTSAESSSGHKSKILSSKTNDSVRKSLNFLMEDSST